MGSKAVKQIRPDRVTIDGRVQRALDQRRVDSMAAKLNLDALGVPEVSERTDGTLVVLDGQHRIEALKVAGFGDAAITMLVRSGLTLEQEAELFRLLNNTKGLSALDKFRISLTERDEESVAINKIVEANGYTTLPGSPDSAIAVVSMRAIFRKDGGQTLHRVLMVTARAWRGQKGATNQTVLQALGAFLFRYGNVIELDRLCRKLEGDRDGNSPIKFLGTIRSLADTAGTTHADAGAGKLTSIYNKDLREGSRLSPWK